MDSKRISPRPGQESVWDYPHPPRLEDSPKHIQIIFNGTVIADTHRAKRVLETSHPPVYYVPPEDIKMDACYVNGEHVQAQAGDFYGGWISRDIVGPFKGEPGTRWW